jgi:carbamate kinase
MGPVEKISKKLAVVALGGNALLKKGETGTTEEQAQKLFPLNRGVLAILFKDLNTFGFFTSL